MATDQLLTHSRMDSFKRCRCRHRWEYEVGIRRTLDAKALRMGSAYHAGLDVLKNGHGVDAAAQAVRDCYSGVPAETEEQANGFDVECETVVAMVSGYDWRWSETKLTVVESEMAFRIPLVNPDTGRPSTNFQLAGKVDGIVQLEDGRLAVLEHKLQSDDIGSESDYWHRLQLDHQITLYVYAACQLGYDVATVLYDVARKPAIRPEQVPIRDTDGLKIVMDRSGNRVRNASKKAKKTCPSCHGSGDVGMTPCQCTLGEWRQTADSASGYTVQSRPMTCDEWIGKLLGDIGERPTWYYARQEIPRLQQDIDDFLVEVWDIQKTLRDAQLGGRWFRTVHRDTCSFCPYFTLCTSRFDPETFLVPDGFEYVQNRHPELGEAFHGSNTST